MKFKTVYNHSTKMKVGFTILAAILAVFIYEDGKNIIKPELATKIKIPLFHGKC